MDEQNAYTEAYARFIMSDNAPQCLQDDIDTFMQQARESESDTSEGEIMNTNNNSSNASQVEEWMLICQSYSQLDQHDDTEGGDVYWLEAGRAYPNLDENPQFIVKHKGSHVWMANTCTPKTHSYFRANTYMCMERFKLILREVEEIHYT